MCANCMCSAHLGILGCSLGSLGTSTKRRLSDQSKSILPGLVQLQVHPPCLVQVQVHPPWPSPTPKSHIPSLAWSLSSGAYSMAPPTWCRTYPTVSSSVPSKALICNCGPGLISNLKIPSEMEVAPPHKLIIHSPKLSFLGPSWLLLQ